MTEQQKIHLVVDVEAPVLTVPMVHLGSRERDTASSATT